MSDPSGWLAPHYRRFRVAHRLLLTGHSHQAWPDVALDGHLEAFADAALHVDDKWATAQAKADRVRDGFRHFLGASDDDLALGPNTHELIIRFLSALDLRARPRLVTSDGEFHTVRRQFARLAEEGIEVVCVPAEPADTLASRMAEAVNGDTAAALVSSVLFETARIVPGLDRLARVCHTEGAELLIDAYHALGVVPFPAVGLETAWVVGGGYKYLQLGEGSCFLRLPGHADRLRPAVTGWFAEFAELGEEPVTGAVRYPVGAARFAGATYDPTSHYRAARVFNFFAEHGLTSTFLRQVSLRQVGLLRELFDAIDAPDWLITRDRSTPAGGIAGFLALRTPYAAHLQAALASRDVRVDARGEYLRFGPAPYLSDTQLERSMEVLAAELARVSPTRHHHEVLRRRTAAVSGAQGVIA